MLTLGFMFLRYYRIYVVCLVLELLGSWEAVSFVLFFIWLYQVLAVALGIFDRRCGMQDI